MSRVLHDFSAAVRSLVHRPTIFGVVVLMLALGLGFNTALFAVVEAVLLRPLPYPEPDRVMMLWTGRNADGTGGVNSYADFLEWQQSSRSFSALATFNISFGTLTGSGDPEEVNGSTVSGDFFTVLGTPLLYGRGIAPGDERIAVDDVRPIVLAHSLWIRRFGADPSIVGRTITLSGRSRLVVGVVASGFRHPEPFWHDAEYWSPMTVTDEMRTQHGYRYLRAIGRLRPGATMAEAQREMDAIGRRLMQTLPATHDRSVIVSPVHRELAGDTRPLSIVFVAATGLVLVLVVANVVNLLLGQISNRHGELAIRAALGAGRARLMSLVVAESVLLGLAGGVAGLIVGQLGIRAVIAYGPGNLPGIEGTSLNFQVVLFAVILSLVVGLVCGVLPAARLARADLSHAFGDLRRSTGLEVSRKRTFIVATELALAVPLVLGAVLLTRTLIALQQVDPGFDANRALQFRVNLAGAQYEQDERRIALVGALVERLGALSGVSAIGASSSVPLGGLNNTGSTIVFERPGEQLGESVVGTRVVTPGYFAALGVPLRSGSVFTTSTDRAGVVINERAAEALWGGINPIGRRLRLGSLTDPPREAAWMTVIGVVGDVRHEALGRPANAEIFQHYESNPRGTMTVVMRAHDDTRAFGPSVRSVMKDLDPSLAVVDLAPLGTLVDGQFARPRFGVLCSVVFGSLGIVLAAIGTFSVLWLMVAQRTREIGIRMALGATRASIAGLVLVQSMTPALVGVGIGALLSVWLARALDVILFGVTARDPVAFGMTVAAVLAVAILATVLPATRAMRVDPIVTLRVD